METFELKQEHLDLLKRAWVSWEDCEYGAPAINCKRPYGNSDVEEDIAEILGWTLRDDELTSSQREEAATLHKETQTALQVILSTQSFELGVYENYEKYDDTAWRKKVNE